MLVFTPLCSAVIQQCHSISTSFGADSVFLGSNVRGIYALCQGAFQSSEKVLQRLRAKGAVGRLIKWELFAGFCGCLGSPYHLL